jgi:hypothetical protein
MPARLLRVEVSVSERAKLALLCAVVLYAGGGCKDDGESPIPTIDAGASVDSGTSTPADAGPSPTDAGASGDAGAADCYPTPKSYVELINACTDAEKVVKNPSLPLLGADGGLPPLP